MFEEQIESLKDLLRGLWSRLEETSLYNSLNERYTSLPRNIQKLINFSILALILVVGLSFPITQYSSSLENDSVYEKRKSITQKVINYARAKSSAKPDPLEYNQLSFKGKVEKIATSKSILQEQLTITSASDKSGHTPKGALQNRFRVTGSQLNLNQAITTAYGIKRMGDSLFLDSVEIRAQKKDPHYFDTNFVVSNFYVAPESRIAPKPPSKKNNRKRRGR